MQATTMLMQAMQTVLLALRQNHSQAFQMTEAAVQAYLLSYEFRVELGAHLVVRNPVTAIIPTKNDSTER